MATKQGSISHPSYLVLDEEEIAGQTLLTADQAVGGFAVAVIEAVCDQQWSIYLNGTADPGYTGAADPPALYVAGEKLQVENIGGDKWGAFHVDVRGLRWLRVILYNTSADAGAVSLRVSLR